MAFPTHSSEVSRSPPGFKTTNNQSVLVESGEIDDVEVALEAEKTKPIAKPWAHFIAGGYVLDRELSKNKKKKPSEEKKKNMLIRLKKLFRAGGMTSAALTSPLDVLKTRLQSDFYQTQLHSLRAAHPLPQTSSSVLSISRSAMIHLNETVQILRSIHVHEGWRALFKGLGPNLTGVVPARAINFYAYGNGKRILNDYFGYDPTESPMSVHLGAAAAAGIVTGTATNPIWLVKTRLQLDKNAAHLPGRGRQYKNSWDCIKQTVRHEGIRGLYRGLSASYLGVTESSLQWVMYEEMKRVMARWEVERNTDPAHIASWVDDVKVWGGKLLAAGSAKLIAAGVTYPHEVVRTRLRQAPTVPASGGKVEMKYTGLAQCFRTIFKEEGMIGLYGGLTPHLLRVVPSAAIMFGM